MAQNFYRFKKTRVEKMSVLKGNDSWFAIRDAQGGPLFACHVVGSCLGGTSTFHRSEEDSEVLFRLEPKRKLLNLTYFVAEGADGPRLATIELFKGRGFKVLGPDGREQYRAVDPQSLGEKFMQTVLESTCTRYALVDDDEVIGIFEPRQRPEDHTAPPQGRIRKFLSGLARALTSDYCVEIDDEGKGIDDHRPLLAALILLQEQTIAHDQAT